MIAYALHRLQSRTVALLSALLFVVTTLIVISCGGGNTSMQSPNMGTVNVSISDPSKGPAEYQNFKPHLGTRAEQVQLLLMSQSVF